MFPNLFEATKTYWRKLDELEAAYQQGKVSTEVVNATVAELMAELAQERRAALTFFVQSGQHWLVDRKDTLLGFAILAIAIYGWVCLKVW
jgi:hypothetical protein